MVMVAIVVSTAAAAISGTAISVAIAIISGIEATSATGTTGIVRITASGRITGRGLIMVTARTMAAAWCAIVSGPISARGASAAIVTGSDGLIRGRPGSDRVPLAGSRLAPYFMCCPGRAGTCPNVPAGRKHRQLNA